MFPYIWPYITTEQVREAMFTLNYHQHEGSGLTWTREDFLNADIGEIIWFVERLQDQREAEVKAIRKAHKK